MTTTTRRRPSRPSVRELLRVGVTFIARPSPRLRCQHCGQTWWPNVQPSGRMPRGYWHCPNGCNKEAV